MPSAAVLDLILRLKDEASAGLASVGSALGTLGGVAGGAALAGVAALGAGIAVGIGDAREAAQIMGQTEAVIKSTGGAAGVTAQQVADMAGAFSAAEGKSLFGDSDIQQGQNLLLTFTNIKETLPETTGVMVDMAQAMGTDVKGGAIALGKALNDPIAGVSALSRVGVTFTDQQKEQIKTLQDSGDMAGAQRIILAELNKEFGGSAEAAAKADGGFTQFKDRLGELAEGIGAALLPAMNQFMGIMNSPEIMGGITALADGLSAGIGMAMDWLATTAIPALQAAWEALQPAFQAIGDFITGSVIPAVMELAAWFSSQLPAAFQFLSDIWTGTLEPVLATLIDWFAAVIPAAISALVTYWESTLLPVFGALVDLWTSSLQPALADLGNWLGAVLPGVVQTLAGFWTSTLQPAIATVAQFIASTVIPMIGELVNWLRDNMPAAIATLSAFWTSTLQPAIAAVWQFITGSLIPTLQTTAATVIPAVQQAVATLAQFWTSTLQPALAVVSGFISGTLMPIIMSLVSASIVPLGAAVAALALVWTTVLQPALSAIWSFISGTLAPIFVSFVSLNIAVMKLAVAALALVWTTTLQPALSTISGFITGTLGPALSTLASGAMAAVNTAATTLAGVYNTTLAPALSGVGGVLGNMQGWFNNISSAIQGLISWINKAIAKLKELGDAVPDMYVGGSPPPLAIWLGYIADALANVSSKAGTFSGLLDGLAKKSRDFMKGGFAGVASLARQEQDNIDALSQLAGPTTDQEQSSKRADLEAKQEEERIALLAKHEREIAASTIEEIAALREKHAQERAELEEEQAEDLAEANQQRVIVNAKQNAALQAQELLRVAKEQALAYNDPEMADQFFALRSQQILELADLEMDRVKAEQEGDAQGVAAAQRKIDLEKAAQAAEGEQFKIRAQERAAELADYGRMADEAKKKADELYKDNFNKKLEAKDLIGQLENSIANLAGGLTTWSDKLAAMLGGLPVATGTLDSTSSGSVFTYVPRAAVAATSTTNNVTVNISAPGGNPSIIENAVNNALRSAGIGADIRTRTR